MISVNTNYTNLISSGANIEWRITNGSNTYTVANILSGSGVDTSYLKKVPEKNGHAVMFP